MKFEKITENKIRITLTSQDLEEQKVDFHSFMANSIESQQLFLDMLDKAEEEIGFTTKNYRIKLDALAMNDGDFILTVTRLNQSNEIEKPQKRKVSIKRKKANLNSTHAVYTFNSFEDFIDFYNFIQNNNFSSLNQLAKDISLFIYKENYFLCLSSINSNYKSFSKFFSSITEFATYLNSSEIFISKLHESGTILLKNNAFNQYKRKIKDLK